MVDFLNLNISHLGKSTAIYYYYYSHDCKFIIKEKEIEEIFDDFVDELVEYDSVVN